MSEVTNENTEREVGGVEESDYGSSRIYRSEEGRLVLGREKDVEAVSGTKNNDVSEVGCRDTGIEDSDKGQIEQEQLDQEERVRRGRPENNRKNQERLEKD